VTELRNSIRNKAQRILAAATRGGPWPVMASPPTRTAGSPNQTSVLLGVDVNTPQVAGTDARLLYLNGIQNNSKVQSMNSPSTTALASNGVGYSFETDAEAFEIRFQTFTNYKYRVAVTDLVAGGGPQWTQAADYVITGDGGTTFQYDLFDFGAGNGRPRRIDVFFSASSLVPRGVCVGLSPQTFTGTTHSNTTIDGITDTSLLTKGALVTGTGIPANTTIATIASGTSITISQAATASATVSISTRATSANNPYTVWLPVDDDYKTLVWGDSWEYGIGISNLRDSWPHKMGEHLGLRNVVASGVGGQGYLTNGNDGAALTFRGRAPYRGSAIRRACVCRSPERLDTRVRPANISVADCSFRSSRCD
jgi:hypothetical protein